MRPYRSLYRRAQDQHVSSVFAHFYALNSDYDATWKSIARDTIDGFESWGFTQKRFIDQYHRTTVPKLKNYLDYTFVRLIDLEMLSPGEYFRFSEDGEWAAFNTGLQNSNGVDLLMVFEKYKPKPLGPPRDSPDWVFKGCFACNQRGYRDRFGVSTPRIAHYSYDSRDFVFDTRYKLEKDGFDHLFERAKFRSGMPNASDEVVRNYLRGALENLVPKICRNYKVAIPVWYVEQKKMQLLLPFYSASDSNDISCFVVERDDDHSTYRMKTIFDLDHAYFSARLITRPDKEWLNP
jgi:hypothetical protein